MRADAFCDRLTHAPVDRLLTDLLNSRIHRRVHLQTALVHGALAEEPLELRDRVGREVRVAVSLQARRPLRNQTQRRGVGSVGLRGGDVAALDHAVQYVALAIARQREIRERRVHGRRGHHAGEHGGLGERKFIDATPEIGVRGRFDAVGARAEVDDVEIALEDLVLRVVALDLDGEQRLLHLARDRDLVGEEQPARELLRDRGRTLKLLMREVRKRRAHDPADVDAVVVVEIVILVRDERVAHHDRDARDRNPDAVLLVERGEQRSVARVDACRARGLVVGHAADIGKVARVRGHHPRNSTDRKQHEEQRGDADTGPHSARATGALRSPSALWHWRRHSVRR